MNLLARALNKRHPSVSPSPDYLKQREPDMRQESAGKQTGFTHQTGDIFRCWLGIRKISAQRACDMYGASTTKGTTNERK